MFISLVPGTRVETSRFSVDCVLSLVASSDGGGSCFWGVEGRTFLPRAGQKEGNEREGPVFLIQDFFLKEKNF